MDSHRNVLVLLVVFVMLIAIRMSFGKPRKVFMLPSNRDGISQQCQQVKREFLLQRLGQAYNHRFMAMDFVDITRQTADRLESLPEGAFQESRYGNHSIREKRSSAANPDQWTCNTTSSWKTLGRDYFPRYYKSIKCSTYDCYGGIFRCRAKYFKLQVLKRKPGACRKVVNSSGVPSFEEFWELHEVSVPLYCVCGN